jgi:hypothetical protein
VYKSNGRVPSAKELVSNESCPPSMPVSDFQDPTVVPENSIFIPHLQPGVPSPDTNW